MNGHGTPLAWTVEAACAELGEQFGCHVSPRDLRGVIRFLPGFPPPVAEVPPGPSGGRGARLYRAGDLQALGDCLVRRGWLQSPPLTEEEIRDRKRGVGKQAERAARRR